MSDTPDDPFGDTPPPRGRGPGRRPPVRGSRARTGGSAQPVQPQGGAGSDRGGPSAGGRSRRPNSAPGRGPRRESAPSQEAPGNGGRGSARRPPSFAPSGSGGNAERPRAIPPAGPEPTRVMPAGQQGGAPSPARRPAPSHAPGGRAQPDAYDGGPPPGPPPAKPRRKRRGRRAVVILVLLLVLVLAWPVGLMIWANGKIQHIDAGESTLDTRGTTYLLAGSDSRDDDEDRFSNDPTEGQRADTIMILTVPPSGTTSLISLPRDTYVEIPGHGMNKLNAAFSFGGPPLLRETVEGLTGIGVDHYVEIGMGGLANVVDAVGGVQLCLDYDVDDADSRLVWEAGCHMSDGETALAFARMRYADPLGDIGRTQRQQQVIQAITSTVADPGLAVRPGEQVRLVDAGVGALHVSEGTNITNLGRMALAFRNASGSDGVRGAPPIADMSYRPGGIGAAVLLEDHYTEFFASVADGSVTQEDTNDGGE